jgi:hypothetical protein
VGQRGLAPLSQPPYNLTMASAADSGSCRLCRVYCDWTIDPAGCVDSACPNLYAYDDAAGRRVVGCVERVFTTEIDLEVLARIREAHGGRFGPLRAARRPLPLCRSAVERAYGDRVPAAGCLNPEFAEPTEGEPFRVTASPRSL